MAAAKDSLAEHCPGRLVLRGLQDPGALGDKALRQGVLTLIATGLADWQRHTGREGEHGKLEFIVAGYIRLQGTDTSTEHMEQAEAALEHDVLRWVRNELKPAPLDAIYPLRCTYSGGLETPVGWFVMELEAMYV